MGVYQALVNVNMSNRDISSYQAVTDLILSKRSVWLSWLAFFGISLMLAGRTLYTAPDDDNYLNIFDGVISQYATDWWLYFLAEPLWLGYTALLAGVLPAETSLRLTIFISSMMFLFASNKLTRGAWIFICLGFLIDSTLATQIYYNQIRQGLALSVFLMLVAARVGPIWGGVVASAIHSSFLLIIPCAIVAMVGKKSSKHLMISIFTLLVVIFAFRSSFFGILDLGRRADIYELKGALSIFFYIFVISQYGFIYLMLRANSGEVDGALWLKFIFVFVVIALFVTLFHEAAGRYVCVMNALVMSVIGARLRNTGPSFSTLETNPNRFLADLSEIDRARICSVFWLLTLLAIQLNEDAKTDFGQDSWIGRWVVIVGW